MVLATRRAGRNPFEVDPGAVGPYSLTQEGVHVSYTGDSCSVQRISVVMITLNEEANLIRALESVAWCDEIVILDSGSTDGTMEIASGFSNCRVFLHEFDGYGAQKRRAVDAAANDWVFSLDADEQLDGELQDALRRWSDSEVSDDAGYEVGRQLRFMGRTFRHGKESRQHVVRLFDRRRGNFDDSVVHEKVRVQGPVGSLGGSLVHESYRDLDDYFTKFNRYTTLMAGELRARGRKTSMAEIILRTPWAFLQYYLLRGNFMNGFAGFVWSLLAAHYKTVKYLKLYELNNRKGAVAEGRLDGDSGR